MGADLDTSLAPLREVAGSDGDLIARVIALGSSHGGSLARSLRSVATNISARDRLAHDARAAASAGKLSMRLLACLGLGSAVLMPAWHSSSLGAVAVSAVGAALLSGIGTFWMRRLLPTAPPGDHPVAAGADLVAALVEGGIQVRQACDLALPPVTEMERAARQVRLGLSWSDALTRDARPDPCRLARALERDDVAEALRTLATVLRDERARRCEIEARRAPVLLVLPLTLCFLPAFGLIVAVPLLRGLAG
jgi:hypothetical protein